MSNVAEVIDSKKKTEYIQPVGDHILVEVQKAERVLASGIVIPEPEAARKDQANVIGTIIDVGPLAFLAEKKHEKEFGVNCQVPKAGDKIAFAKYAGYNVSLNDRENRIISDADVTAIIREGK